MPLFPYRLRIQRKDVHILLVWQALRESSDHLNPLPPFLSRGQACPGLAGQMPLQGLRRPDHVYSQSCGFETP